MRQSTDHRYRQASCDRLYQCQIPTFNRTVANKARAQCASYTLP